MGLEGSSPKVSSSCEETGRSYIFVKALTSIDLTLKIDYSPHISDYEVVMKKQ